MGGHTRPLTNELKSTIVILYLYGYMHKWVGNAPILMQGKRLWRDRRVASEAIQEITPYFFQFFIPHQV